MKHRIIPLLISCFVILTSMSECKKGEVLFLTHVEYSPIDAELNGVPGHSLSGYFEFTAVNEELGMTISVTNGTFENLWT